MRIISVSVLKITRWRAEGGIPSTVQKCVVIAAPHTSNFDFPIMLMVSFALKINMHWMGKESLFRFPFYGIMTWLGGIPVNRNSSHNMVENSSQMILSAKKDFRLALSPEGTRKTVFRWKTGFYYIALGARVPIVLGYIDYPSKRCGIAKVFFPTGDSVADIEKIQAVYSPYKGKNF
jgi:1-acyl-sn-glycerol-3-phosphate acyltransferase